MQKQTVSSGGAEKQFYNVDSVNLKALWRLVLTQQEWTWQECVLYMWQKRTRQKHSDITSRSSERARFLKHTHAHSRNLIVPLLFGADKKLYKLLM